MQPISNTNPSSPATSYVNWNTVAKTIFIATIIAAATVAMATVAAAFIMSPPALAIVASSVISAALLVVGVAGVIYTARKVAEIIIDILDLEETPEFTFPTIVNPSSEEFKQFAANFQEGDIIFFKLDSSKFGYSSMASNEDRLDFIILKSQGMVKSKQALKKELDTESYIHVGILLKNSEGELLLVEATAGDSGDDVRIVDIKNAALTRTSKQKYVIFRHKNPKEARLAADLAKRLAEKVDYDQKGKVVSISGKEVNKTSSTTKLRYSKVSAATSLVGDFKMGKRAREELFYFYALKKDNPEWVPTDRKNRALNFYCSYFVSFCIQNGSSETLIDQILTDEEKIELGDLLLKRNSYQELRKWAARVSDKHIDEINQKFPYQYDPKRMSPQELWHFMKKHDEMFEHVGSIVPPT